MWEFKQFKYIEVGSPGFRFLRREQNIFQELTASLPAQKSAFMILDGEFEWRKANHSTFP